MMSPEWIGYLACCCTTGAYIPQAIKAFRERKTQNLSIGMWILMTCGNAAWLAYGYLINSPSIMVANALTVMLAALILMMKIRHG